MYRLLRSTAPLVSLLALTSISHAEQRPLRMPDSNQQATLQSSSVTLSDVLPRSQSIGIFSSFCNDISSVSSMLASTSQNLTVLAPEDAAIKRLPRKPWEDPADYDKFGTEAAYAGQEGVDRAQENLKRFVEAHVVPVSPWGKGEKIKRVSGEGGEVWWEKKDGKMVLQPG